MMVKLNVSSVIVATIITMLAVAIITIAKEISKPIYVAFKTLGGHHWVGTSIVLVIIFAILIFILELSLRKPLDIAKWMWIAMIVSLLSYSTIFLFYVVHFLS